MSDFVIISSSAGEDEETVDIIDAELVLPAPECDYEIVQDEEEERVFVVEEEEAAMDVEPDVNVEDNSCKDDSSLQGVAETVEPPAEHEDGGDSEGKKEDDSGGDGGGDEHGEESRKSGSKSDLDTDSVSSSVSKKKRGVTLFSPGTKVEAQDFQEKWYPAKVVTVDEEDRDVLIHFEGWSSRYDEWVSMDSSRLRFTPQQSTRKSLKLKSTKKTYKKGEEVLARWADGRKYPAKILEVNDDESYLVLFYDGFEKRVKGINIEKMPPDKKGSVTFPKSAPKDSPAKQESKKASKEQETGPKKASALPDAQKTDSKRARHHQERGDSSMKPKGQKSGSKTEGSGKKAEKRDGSISSSSSSSTHGKKKVLLVGGKFMAKREENADVPLRMKKKKKKEEKKDRVKRKRGFSATDGGHPKKERKTSAPRRDSSGQSSTSSSMPSTPAEYSSGVSDALAHIEDVSVAPQFTPDGRRIAPKEFIIEADHNHFKCTFGGCNKSFRKEPLLQSHLKHYHGTSSPTTTTTPGKRRFSDVAHAEKALQTKEPVHHPAETISRQEVDVTVETESVPCSGEGASEEPLSADVGKEMATIAEQSAPPSTEAVTVPTSVDAVADVIPAVPVDGATLQVSDATVCSPAVSTSTSVPPPVGTPTGAVVHKTPRRMRFIPHYESLAQGREKRKIAKTEKALIADMEAAANRRGSHGERKRKRTSSTRSDKSEEGQVKPATSKESRKQKMPDAGQFASNGDASELHASHGHHKGKRKRHSIASASDSNQSSHSHTGKDQLEPDQVKCTDPVDISSDEIVRCSCNCEEESGLMMQCEVCLTWQHGACFSIEEEKDVPDKYVCYFCLNPRAVNNEPAQMQGTIESSPGVRESFRYKHDQDWFTRGEMASFAFLKDSVLPSPRPAPVKATHNLMASMHSVFSALRGMTHKINIASVEDHPDLKHFAVPWGQGGCTKSNLCGKSSEMTAGEMTDFSRPGRDILVSPFDHTYFGQPECSNGVQEAPDVVVTSLEEPPEEILVQQDVDGLEVGCVEEVTVPKSAEELELDVIAGEEEVIAVVDDCEDSSSSQVLEVPVTEAGVVQEGEQHVVPPSVAIGSQIDPEVCKKNLLNHIFSMQDQLDLKLTSMEEKLQALENESNVGSNNPSLSEAEEVLKLRLSLKGLMKDLNAVHRLSMFH